MPYTATSWVNATTPLNATNMNHIETIYAEATLSFEQDLFTAFVYSGLVATKDGSINNQLDVTAGVAFLLQSDSTLRRRAPTSSTQTTSAINATYKLFLQPDGTWFWTSTGSGWAANSLWVAQATTDASGNILLVTDTRTLNTTLLSNMSGALLLTAPVLLSNGTALSPRVEFSDPVNNNNAWLDMSGQVFRVVANYHGNTTREIAHFDPNTGNLVLDFALGGVGGQATAGNFGAPVIVASVYNQVVTVTTAQTLISVGIPAGLYRISGAFSLGNGTSGQHITFSWSYSGITGAALAYLTVFTSATAFVALNGSADSLTTNADWITWPQVFVASAGTLTVTYQDPANTPNDHVSVIIERLA